MEVSTARFVLDGVAVGAVAVWTAASLFVAGTRRRLQEPITGSAELAGDADDLIAHAAATLVRGEPGTPLQQIAIDRCAGRELSWHGAFPMVRHRGALRIAPAAGGGRALATWTLETSSSLFAARIVLLAGALVAIVLYLALRTWVLTSDSPAIRAQVLQMTQCVHLLWPPFLLAGLARAARTRLAGSVARLVQNLPHAAAVRAP